MDSSPQRITIQASAVLPAAGVFTTPLRINCAHASVVQVAIAYTEGAVVGGAFAMITEVFDGITWRRATLDNVGSLTVKAVAPLIGTVSMVDQAIKEWQPNSPVATSFSVVMGKSFFAIRFSFAEYPPATLNTPGTLSAFAVVSVG